MFDRALLQVHLMMCGSCRNVEQQLGHLREMSHDLFATDDAAPDEPGEGR